MPWKEESVKEQRIRFVARALSGKETMSGLCREFGISRPTGYLWLGRYLKHRSFQALQEKSRRPNRSPGRSEKRWEEAVEQLSEIYGWGARKLQVRLRQERGIELSVSTVHRILKRRGLLQQKADKKQAPGRFEREVPNELWQMDFKGEYEGANLCYPLTVLDDHSRYSIGVYALESTAYQGVWERLQEMLMQYGVPDEILMDHGVPWWGTATERGWTRLRVNLMEQGIRLCFSGIGHPQTQGKAERFHRTLQEAVRHRGGPPVGMEKWQRLFDEIRREYNEVRPHEALGMQVPASRYRPSAKRYQPNPAEWEYPESMQVHRVGSNGNIRWGGRAYFVSMSLVTRNVGVEKVDDKLLIGYRGHSVREIQIDSGRGRSLI